MKILFVQLKKNYTYKMLGTHSLFGLIMHPTYVPSELKPINAVIDSYWKFKTKCLRMFGNICAAVGILITTPLCIEFRLKFYFFQYKYINNFSAEYKSLD